jgi:hypothetical protein
MGGSESGRRQQLLKLGQQKVSVYKTSDPIFVRKAAVWPVTKQFFFTHCVCFIAGQNSARVWRGVHQFG